MPSHGTDSASSTRDRGSDTGGGDDSGLPPFESSPFTDWREQLRERVKEIRARKLADKRDAEGRSANGTREQADTDERQADAARDDKLQVARDRAARVRQGSDDAAPERMQPTARETAADEIAAGNEVDADEIATDETPNEEIANEEIANEEMADEEMADEEIADEEIAAAAREALGRIQAEADLDPPDDDAAPGTADAASDHDSGVDAGDRPDRDDVPLFQDDDTAVAEDLDDPLGDATLAPDDIPWRTDWDADAEEDADGYELDDPAGQAADADADDDIVWEDDPVPARDAAPDTAPERRREPLRDDPDDALVPPGGHRRLDNIPAWARPRNGDEDTAGPRAEVAPPDLDAIPAELKDVAIPSWAIPRRTERASSEAAESDGTAPAATEDAPPEREADATADATAHTPADARASDPRPVRYTDGRRKISDLLAWDEERSDASPAGEPQAESHTRLDERLQSGPEDTDALEADPLDALALDADVPDTDVPDTDVLESDVLDADIGEADALEALEAEAEEEDDRDEPPSPPRIHGSDRPRDTGLGDVYLVGEFTGRRGGGKEVGAGDRQEASRHIPNLFEDSQEQEHEIEVAPPPFRGLFDEGSDEEEAADGDDSWSTHTAPKVELDLDDIAEEAGTTIEDDAGPARLDPSAPVSDRVFSALADALVVVVLGLVLGLAGAGAAGTGMLSFVQAAPIPFAGAWMIFAFVYGIFFIGTCGQTIGKMAMRVRVIGSDRFQVGYAKAARRAFLYTALTALSAGLELLPALRDPEHRALHDRLSGTRVVKA